MVKRIVQYIEYVAIFPIVVITIFCLVRGVKEKEKLIIHILRPTYAQRPYVGAFEPGPARSPLMFLLICLFWGWMKPSPPLAHTYGASLLTKLNSLFFFVGHRI